LIARLPFTAKRGIWFSGEFKAKADSSSLRLPGGQAALLGMTRFTLFLIEFSKKLSGWKIPKLKTANGER